MILFTYPSTNEKKIGRLQPLARGFVLMALSMNSVLPKEPFSRQVSFPYILSAIRGKAAGAG